jgi:hypothetical protein
MGVDAGDDPVGNPSRGVVGLVADPATGQAFINPLRAHPPNGGGWEVDEHLPFRETWALRAAFRRILRHAGAEAFSERFGDGRGGA